MERELCARRIVWGGAWQSARWLRSHPSPSLLSIRLDGRSHSPRLRGCSRGRRRGPRRCGCAGEGAAAVPAGSCVCEARRGDPQPGGDTPEQPNQHGRKAAFRRDASGNTHGRTLCELREGALLESACGLHCLCVDDVGAFRCGSCCSEEQGGPHGAGPSRNTPEGRTASSSSSSGAARTCRTRCRDVATLVMITCTDGSEQ